MSRPDLSAAAVAAYCRSRGYPDPVPEYRFHPTRKWCFDLAFPAERVAVEFEGFAPGGAAGRHQRPRGYEGDCEKYSTAAATGWRVIRVTHRQVKAGLVFTLLDLAFKGPTPKGT